MNKLTRESKRWEIDKCMRFLEESKNEKIKNVIMYDYVDHHLKLTYEFNQSIINNYIRALKLFKKSCNDFWKEECKKALKFYKNL